jgi:ATP-dependent helicase/nuclease subunit A
MDFTPAQHDAIYLDQNLVVAAGAGSGKTRVLVERYLRLLTAGAPVAPDNGTPPAPRDILAITFTEKAAREMRDRVRRAVEERARLASSAAERIIWENHRASVEAASIGTIHSFCATLLRAQPAESGIDPQFEVLDEIQRGLLLSDSVDAALNSAAAEDQPAAVLADGLPVLRDTFSLDELRGILMGMVLGGGEVRAAIAELPTTAADLVAHWNRTMADVQAETLTELLSSASWRDASATLNRLAGSAPATDKIGGQVQTIAAWLADLERRDPATMPDFAALDTINLQGGSKKGWADPADKDAAKAALRALRDSYRAHAALLGHIPDEELEQRSALAVLALCQLYSSTEETYTARKMQQDVLDFDDLERYARELLEHKPDVRARWQAEFQAILVDEFQDTNDEQRAIIYALAGYEPPLDTDTPPGLFVVGDDKQSIYRFRGADVSVFLKVAKQIAAQHGRRVAMDTSFRTHPLLLNWINRVSEAVFARERPLQPYEITFEPLRAHRPAPEHGCCVELHIVSSDGSAAEQRQQEGRILAQRIQALTEGAAGRVVYDEQAGWRIPEYGDVVLLCQASTVFSFYEDALNEAGIPYLTTAGRGYYGRQEVQDLIHLLQVLNDPADELALVGVLRSPLFALDDATILRLRFAFRRSLWSALLTCDPDSAANPEPLRFARDTLRDLHAMRGRLSVVELLRAALAETGYLATISGLDNGAQRRANVEKLLSAARTAGSGGLVAFSAYLDDLLKAEAREGEAPLEAEGSVRLMTVHRSKGLEFPIVVLPDLGRRSLRQQPLWLARRDYGLALRLRDHVGETQQSSAYQLALRAEQRMEQAERERLLYVALTRASDYLLLSGPPRTTTGDDWGSRIVAALGMPWEDGGPETGIYGEMQVRRV